MSLTARDIIHKISNESSLDYQEVAERVNQAMQDGSTLIQAISSIVRQENLNPDDYQISALDIFHEAQSILMEDYTQTLMISAVIAQMVEGSDKSRFPIPAFFAFMEVLATVKDTPEDTISEESDQIDKHTTRLIELMTTLVSIICKWSSQGIVGVAQDCPPLLREIAQQIHWKTKMYQSGIWSCISCGKMVNIKDTRALLCKECDSSITNEIKRISFDSKDRERIGYGQTRDIDE